MRVPSAAILSIKYAGARANDFHHLRLPAGGQLTVDWKIGAAMDAGFTATQCVTMMTVAADKVSCVFAACSLPLRDAGQAQARWFLDLTARFGGRQK